MKKINALFLLLGLLLLVLGIHGIFRYGEVSLPLLEQYADSEAIADLVHHDGIQALVELVAGVIALIAAVALPRVRKPDLEMTTGADQ